VSTTKVEREVLSTLSQHVPTLEPTTNMIMLLAQNPIKKLALSSIQKLKVAHMEEIQNLKDMHVQEVDVLQNQIFRFIINRRTFITFDAQTKRPMTPLSERN
jgi:hypothetical protein